jgi:hypothetical protein
VFSVMRCPYRGYITSLLVDRGLDWRTGSEFRSSKGAVVWPEDLECDFTCAVVQ